MKKQFHTNRAAMTALTLGFAIAGGAAQADMVEFMNDPFKTTESLGTFTGSLRYEFDPFSDRGLLTIAMTNTSEPANGGYITGFLFNIPGNDQLATASLESASYPFQQAFGSGLDAMPFGTYDAGAALGGNFQGGGSPNDGIGVGETGEFLFAITANDANTFNAADFINGSTGDDLVLRFRGFVNGGSDKVIGTIIPAPGALALMGLAFAADRRRRRRSA